MVRNTPFFIPMADIGQRRNIAIWSEDPVEYSVQWAPYRNNWTVLAQALAEASTHPDWGPVPSLPLPDEWVWL